MTEPICNYDEDGDVPYIAFAPGEKGAGVELSDFA
jgi:hypothetical protein